MTDEYIPRCAYCDNEIHKRILVIDKVILCSDKCSVEYFAEFPEKEECLDAHVVEM